MKIINLGGYGGCNLTQVIRKFPSVTEAYPFDWNATTQNFIIKTIQSNGTYFFNFEEDSLLFESNILLSPNKDAFCIHDFTDWNAQKYQVKEKYKRRLNRLISTINSNEQILFCRHLLDVNPYNDYEKSSWSRIPFNIQYDDINLWEDFLSKLNRSAKTKLLCITNNPLLTKKSNDLIICIQKNNYDDWNENTYKHINMLIN